MANMHNQTAVSSSTVTLFQSQKFGGQDIDGCTEFSIVNDGDGDLLLFSHGHHGEDRATTPGFRLGSGKSLTFSISTDEARDSSINLITAVRASATDTTVSGGVVSHR